MRRVLCLNGPNLNLLGTRQPDVYGDLTLADLEGQVVEWGETMGVEVSCFQSNDEGEIVDAIHAARDADGILLNPGAFTHTSLAISDAIAAVPAPVVEVHLSNTRSRQRWRRRSYVTPVCVASIFGRGVESYRAGLRHLINRQAHPVETVRYGPHPDQVVDLRRSGDSSYAVVLVHGGFWLDPWGRDTTETWALDLASRGVTTANLEYRRVGSGGGAIPTTADVVEAVETARSQLGADLWAAVGHSAGAHLAIWAALRGDPPPSGVVAVAGMLDLESADRSGLGNGAVSRFDPEYRTSPTFLPAPSCPVSLVHGADDREVTPDQSRSYAAYLESMDRTCDLSVVGETSHFDLLGADSEAWSVVRDRLARFGAPLS